MTIKPRWSNTWGPEALTERIKVLSTQGDLQKIQKLAEREGRKHLVLTMSEGDLFEQNKQVKEWRRDALDMMPGYDMLTHFLLTKRPWNIGMCSPAEWFFDGGWPENVIIGTSVSIQEDVTLNVGSLLGIPAPLHVVSVAPMLEQIDLGGYLAPIQFGYSVGWVIIEGESGKGARYIKPKYMRYLIDQCREFGIPVYVKQLGGYPDQQMDPDRWPDDLRVREYPGYFGKDYKERKESYEDQINK